MAADSILLLLFLLKSTIVFPFILFSIIKSPTFSCVDESFIRVLNRVSFTGFFFLFFQQLNSLTFFSFLYLDILFWWLKCIVLDIQQRFGFEIFQFLPRRILEFMKLGKDLSKTPLHFGIYVSSSFSLQISSKAQLIKLILQS